MTQVAKFNATQVAVFGKIEGTGDVAETDVLIMTGVTYDPNIPTSSEALVGDFLSRDSVVNITDTFGDFSGDSYVPVLGSLIGSTVTAGNSVLPISRYLECCNLNAGETTGTVSLPSGASTALNEAISVVTTQKDALIIVKNKLYANENGTVADIVDNLTAWAGKNASNSVAIAAQKDVINGAGVKTVINSNILTLINNITSLNEFKVPNRDVDIFKSDVAGFDLAAITYVDNVIAILGASVNAGVWKAISDISITDNALATAYKTKILADLATVVADLTTIKTTYNAVTVGVAAKITAFKNAISSITILEGLNLLKIKFSNAVASNSSLITQIRKSSLDIIDQKVVTLTGVRGTVDLNVKIAERPKFKFNFHGNIASISNETAFSTNINTQKTNIAPVTLSSNIKKAIIAPSGTSAADIINTPTNNISFISFSASNFDGFDLKRTQTGGSDFWYPQGIAHDVTITILEDTAREAYTGSSDTLLSDSTSFRPEDNVGKEFSFLFQQGDVAGSIYTIYMDKLTLKGYKHTTQGNVASIDLTFEASGISELTLS